MEATQKTRYLSCAETAKLVRKALKADWPGVKFSVRSSTYANGASIRVGWTDGPTEQEVRLKTLNLYEGSTFDGMIDLKSPVRSLMTTEDGGFEEVSFGADYVIPNRTLSTEFVEECKAKVEKALGGSVEPDRPTDGGVAIPGKDPMDDDGWTMLISPWTTGLPRELAFKTSLY